MVVLSLARVALLISATLGLSFGNGGWFSRRGDRAGESSSRELEHQSRAARDHGRSLTQALRDKLRGNDPNTLVTIPARGTPARGPGGSALSSLARAPVQQSPVAPRVSQNSSSGISLTSHNPTDKDRVVNEPAQTTRPIESDELRESSQDCGDGAKSLRLELTSITMTAGARTDGASERDGAKSSQSEPGLLPPVLAAMERRNRGTADGLHATDVVFDASDIIGQSRTVEVGLLTRPELVPGTQAMHGASTAETDADRPAAAPPQLLGNVELIALLHRLPGYALPMAVILLAAFCLILSRRRPIRRPVDRKASAAPDSSTPAFFPSASGHAPNAPRDDTSPEGHAGATVGAITATIGLLITVVGIAELLRGYSAGQLAAQRPAMVIAAIGQGILLLGITVQLVYKSRRESRLPGTASANGSASANPPHTFWPNLVPVLPLNAGYPWPVATSVVTGTGHHAGQIAQLKAQLACLSQQLDQLAVPQEATDKPR